MRKAIEVLMCKVLEEKRSVETEKLKHRCLVGG